MPYELYNPHPRSLDLFIMSTRESVMVAPKQYIPTPEMEEHGLTAASFRDCVVPNLLHQTPTLVRRKLLQDEADANEKTATLDTTPLTSDEIAEAYARRRVARNLESSVPPAGKGETQAETGADTGEESLKDVIGRPSEVSEAVPASEADTALEAAQSLSPLDIIRGVKEQITRDARVEEDISMADLAANQARADKSCSSSKKGKKVKEYK